MTTRRAVAFAWLLLILSAPILAATLFADSFTRADGALGASYATGPTNYANALAIVSNKVRGGTLADDCAQIVSGVSMADGGLQLTLSTWTGVTTDETPTFLLRITSTVAPTMYLVNIYNGQMHIDKWVAGVFTGDIVSAVSITAAAADVYKAEAQGTTIRGFQNGVQQITATDSSITGAGAWGFGTYVGGGGSLSDLEIDDVSLYDFTSSAPCRFLLLGAGC